MANDQQINKGIWFHNAADSCPDIVTIAATGLGRSGTTMVARVLGALGVYMGEKLAAQSHEDIEFRQIVKERDLKKFNKLCRRRDEEHEKWGFKCPALRDRLSHYCARMRNPRLIITFRDMLAISIRNNVSVQSEVIESLVRTSRGYQLLVDQLVRYQGPTMMISYEKALQFPEDTVRAIMNFCGIAEDAAVVSEIAAMIENGEASYMAKQDELLSA